MATSLAEYEIINAEEVQTPALIIYPRFVDANIEAILEAIDNGRPPDQGGRTPADRWRPHLKTTKSKHVIERLLKHGVRRFKVATTRELLAACEAGASDVLVAYPVIGANARRVESIACQFPGIAVSLLVEDLDSIRRWKGKPVGLFLDLNPGMDRTGIQVARHNEIVGLAKECGAQFRGIHYYDGHRSGIDYAQRERDAHAGYEELLELVRALSEAGAAPGEVITSGTPAFPCALSFAGFNNPKFVHRVSPGTTVYNDMLSLRQLASIPGLRPAAIVMATVVSHPTSSRFTCNAGHKAVSADEGVPTCAILGHPDWQPLKPSEEHLPVDVPAGTALPPLGTTLYLLPRHVCPTVNLFDAALTAEHGRIIGLWPVDARGHEGPSVSAA
jgi:D-serine deaminase-like pyridoxal phosphate-dependent protein